MLFSRPKSRSIFRDSRVTEVAFQLFSCGMVWDGNLCCKTGRDLLVQEGYAARCEGLQALTGKGTFAFLTSPHVWRFAWGVWRRRKHNPFVASPKKIREAMS